jgi:hypothetical protein
MHYIILLLACLSDERIPGCCGCVAVQDSFLRLPSDIKFGIGDPRGRLEILYRSLFHPISPDFSPLYRALYRDNKTDADFRAVTLGVTERPSTTHCITGTSISMLRLHVAVHGRVADETKTD